MTTLRERFAREVEALVGTPFRLHGRDEHTGVDCVGLVLCALSRAGFSLEVPRYRLRNKDVSGIIAFVDRLGFERVEDGPIAGDIYLAEIGPTQFHVLAIGPGGHTVHAHAGLRRVVCQTSFPPWPIQNRWRIPENTEDLWPLSS